MEAFAVISLLFWCGVCFWFGYWCWDQFGKRTARQKWKCRLGLHAPDVIREEGQFTVSRCLYCDRVVHRFDKTQGRIV